MGRYAIGFDFGTLSARALLLDLESGQEIADAAEFYPHGVIETALSCGKALPSGWALQDPADYLSCMAQVSASVMRQSGIAAEEIVGIGLDFTSSTVLPVDENGTPLCQLPAFFDEPHAYVKLWKHHGAEREAVEIDRLARERGEAWLNLYGGKVSSEWMVPKILETVRHAPEVYHHAAHFMEAMDWIVWRLTGAISRSSCAAGYKSFYRHDSGYPSQAFLDALEPRFSDLLSKKLYGPVVEAGTLGGRLTAEMAAVLGLCAGIPVGVGVIDAHASVIGSGISEPGTMMIIVGTSSCHMLLSERETEIPGIAGVVKDGIVPGYFAYEAGQSCVGDLYAWFVKNCVPERYEKEAAEQNVSMHQLLTEKLQDYQPGQSGLLALDWHNGVRSPLMDFDLNGLILGMNLQTTPEEVYLSLIEATAYGTRMIVESFENAGVHVDQLLMSGGIPLKNPLLVQIYSDVCNREIVVSSSSNASVRGAALLGAAASGFYGTLKEIVQKYAVSGEHRYVPRKDHVGIYDQLYREYCQLHAYFGTGGNHVMKRLNQLRHVAQKKQ